MGHVILEYSSVLCIDDVHGKIVFFVGHLVVWNLFQRKSVKFTAVCKLLNK